MTKSKRITWLILELYVCAMIAWGVITATKHVIKNPAIEKHVKVPIAEWKPSEVIVQGKVFKIVNSY